MTNNFKLPTRSDKDHAKRRGAARSLRNHAVPRGLSVLICEALETDWLAGAPGIEPPHSEAKFAKTPAWGCGIRLDLLNFVSPQRDVGVDRAPACKKYGSIRDAQI
jgi:hypothetical protein